MADVLPPDENRGPEILIVCGTLVGIAVVMVILRLYVRAFITRHVGFDDYTMLAAMVFLFAEMMIIIKEVEMGGGRHNVYITPPENITKGLHLNFVTQPLCLIVLAFTKTSVGLFLLRMTPSKGYGRFIIGMIVFTVLSSTGNLLTVFFQCRPLAFVWDPTVPGGKCIPPSHLRFSSFFNSSVAIATDFIFALIPIPILWRVKLNLKTKLAVIGILSLGVFAGIAAIVKMPFLSTYGSKGDFLYDSANITIWTTVEICAAMVAGCFPALKPLFRSILAAASSYNKSSPENYRGYTRNFNYAHNTNNNSHHHTRRVNRASRPDNNDFEMYNQPPRKDGHTDATVVATSKMDSKECILVPEDPLSTINDHITRTTRVTVTVDEYEKSVKNMV